MLYRLKTFANRLFTPKENKKDHIVQLLRDVGTPCTGRMLIALGCGLFGRASIYILLSELEDEGRVIRNLPTSDGRAVYSVPLLKESNEPRN